jgi:hypothetical protein
MSTDNIPEINATDYRCPNHLMMSISSGKVPLPVRILIGDSGFKITEANQDAFSLGVLMATDEAWDKKRREQDAIDEYEHEPGDEEVP